MAIAKWIPFGTVQSATSTSDAAKPQGVQVTPADGKQFGLENFCNNCYANSVLQALYFCSPFRELLFQYPDPSLTSPHKSVSATTSIPIPSPTTSHGRRKPGREPTVDSSPSNGTAHPPGPPIPSSPDTLFSALRSLYLHISKNPADKGTVTPRAFIEKLKDVNTEFRNTNHQDAHEFLIFLLNKIVEEIEEERKHQRVATISREDLSISIGTLVSPTIATATTSSNSGTPPQEATLVHKLFEGVLTSETRCLTCETVSSRDESFLDLSIDIEQNSSVTACLRQFSASEMLCQKNKFFCDSCCDLQEAEKRMKIKKLPNVLALHLKRFKYQEDVQKYIKLTYRVAFPLELRLFNTVDDAQNPDRLYELYAIVVHIGNGPHHGHYVTIIRTPANWLVFDDDTVEPIKESEIAKYFGESNSGSAYVLYYQAVDLDLAALGLHPVLPTPQLAEVISTRHSPEPPIIEPTLPPGLADEGESDASDPRPPILPSQAYQPPPIPAFVDKTLRKSSSSYPLTINVPSQNGVVENSGSPIGSPTSTSPSSGTKAGLFQSLRHSPSIKIRGQNLASAGLEKSKSLKEKIGRPATSTGLPKHHKPPDLPPIPVSPVPINGQGCGPEKTKDPERKPSTWFKRKSGRSDKRPGTAIEVPTSSHSGEDAASPSSTTTWFRYNTPTLSNPPKNYRHRPSEPTVGNGGAFQSIGSLGPNMFYNAGDPVGLGLTSHNGASERGNVGYETPAPGSEASSLVSNFGLPVNSPIQKPTIYPLNTTVPSSPRSPIDHKRSQPQLKPKHKEHDLPVSPPRPSTAGGPTRGKTTASEALPPLPSLPTFARSHFRRSSHDQASDTTESEGRPTSYLTTDIDSTSGDLPLASSATATFRRASRKLSLTSPILGFGNRERDKEAKAAAKEKAKEEKTRKEQEGVAITATTLPQFTMTSRI